MLLGRYWYALLAFIGSPGKIRALSIGLVRHLKKLDCILTRKCSLGSFYSFLFSRAVGLKAPELQKGPAAKHDQDLIRL